MMKRFVVIAGAASLLAVIGCSGGSWEETNAFTPVAEATNAVGSSEAKDSISVGSSGSADVASSGVMSDVVVVVEPASSSSENEPQGPAGFSDQPKGAVTSNSSVASSSSHSSLVLSPSSMSSVTSSTAATNVPSGSSDSMGRDESPTSSEMDTLYIPFDPPVVETVTIGSQVWMKKLAAGGQALTWEAAMAAGVCPAGFHVPTYGEVDSLLHMAADGSIVASENDEIGIITGGSKRVRDLGWSEHFGGFWTAAILGGSSAYYFVISATDDNATLHGDLVFNEYYVRCIKD